MHDKPLDRREFLRGAMGLFGMAAMSVAPTAALAKAGRSFFAQPEYTLVFWDGERLIPAAQLPYGEQSLQQVRVTARLFGKAGSLAALDVVSPLTSANGVQHKFRALSASAGHARSARFNSAIDASRGLQIVLVQQVNGSKIESLVEMTSGAGSAPKLRTGTYVLAAQGVDLSGFVLDVKKADGPLIERIGTATAPQYITLKVEQTL
jgi:hypothetical protein